MMWARMLAYITGTVGQELLLRNDYLTAENRFLVGKRYLRTSPTILWPPRRSHKCANLS